MKLYFYIENHALEDKWKRMNQLAKQLDRIGNDVFLYIAQCSYLNSQRINCETKIEGADLIFFFGKVSIQTKLAAKKKIAIAETLEELNWWTAQEWPDEIWTVPPLTPDGVIIKKWFCMPAFEPLENNADYFFKTSGQEDNQAGQVTIAAIVDGNKHLGKILATYENYYSNIRIQSQLILFVEQKDIKKFRNEIYARAVELRCIRNIMVQPVQEFAQWEQITLCIWGKLRSDPELLYQIYQRGLPVFSFRECKDKKILSAGVLLQDVVPEQLQRLFEILVEYPEIRKEISWNQFAKIPEKQTKYGCAAIFSRLKELNGKETPGSLLEEESEDGKLEIQVQGPFETSYSLAIVNKKLAEAFHRKPEVSASIGAMEATGVYEPKYKYLKDKEIAAYLWKKGTKITAPFVAVRNMYPPAVEQLTAVYNFEAFAWEEDRVPVRHIDDFNAVLDGVGTASEFVTQALLDSGLKIPVRTIGIGVELPAYYEKLEPYPIKSKKKIKFLHISSAFPRKGVDILLQAYCEEFTREDEVCLIIKSFPNPHNCVEEQLKALARKKPSMPEIEFINTDMEEKDLYSLYKAADCYIHVARGEGFGLPVTEAMLAKIPVIVSNNTGLKDFCNQNTALLVDYEMEKANSHLSENSRWASPNKETVKKRMRDFYQNPHSAKVQKLVENAYEFISTYYKWDAVADRWLTFINEVVHQQKKPSVAMVTTWNTKCGIAEFTRYFIEATSSKVNYMIYANKSNELVREDEEFVAGRYWDIGRVEELILPLQKSKADIIHIQFNFGLLKLENLTDIIFQCRNQKVVITFHGTNDFGKMLRPESKTQVIDGLNQAYRLIVHQEQDKKNLRGYGILEKKISVIPLGQISYPDNTKEEIRNKLELKSKHIIGSYGFLFPHKGFDKVITAVRDLKERYPDLIYLMVCAHYDSETSKRYLEQCKKMIHSLGLSEHVYLVHDFLKPEESMKLLQACDLLLLPYDKTNESASGAVRFCIAAKRPVITTEQDIFSEYKDCTYQIKENTPAKIAKAVHTLMDEKLQKDYIKKIIKKAEQMSWNRIGRTYINLYSGEDDDTN